MDKLKTAKEIGLRCRRFRNALGLSQDALGEKVGILGATISKYEREGIYDIEKIQELSQALGHDLLMDEIDQEGTIGEIGKEILYRLIRNNGYCSFKQLVWYMYGMSADRVINEIFKLEHIGMCVREQYKDWNNEDTDNVFITAKGIITIKHMRSDEGTSDEIYETLHDVSSYERLIGEYDSYQQYIENSEVERLVRSIDYNQGYPYFLREDGTENRWNKDNGFFSTCHRINYVKYLKNNFVNCVDSEEEKDFGCWDDKEIITGKNIYHDILHRMSLKLTNDFIYDEIICYCGNKNEEDLDALKSILFGIDPVVEKTINMFRDDFNYDISDKEEQERFELEKFINIGEMSIEPNIEQSAQDILGISYSDLKRKIELGDMSDIPEEKYSMFEKDVEVIKDMFETLVKSAQQKVHFNEVSKSKRPLDMNRPEGASIYPIDWFSDEEIREFINENFGPAKTEEDRRLDAILHRINELCPKSLDYYEFPESWEENGLANLIRTNCGLEIPSVKKN